jgi:hypothetical protein
MQQHRWRWLWIWVGVLVAGCGQVWSSEGTRTATREPTLPLFGYTLLPPSLTPGFWSAYTATPLIVPGSTSMIVSPSPIALYLNVTGPTCYETPVGSLVCLGQVYNMLDSPVEQITVGVQLLARDGTLLATGEALLARWLLPAGSAGPYRVLFDALPDGFANARPFIMSGQIAPSVGDYYANLTLQEVSGTFVIDQYQVSLSLINLNPEAVEHVAVTMTLLDDQHRVTGFRQVYLDADRRLAPGESLALTVKVIPQGPNTVAFDAFAEGYLVQN